MIDPLPSDIFKSGQVLNNTYEIEGVLGRGGTGEVYRAVNSVTGRVFAIKALSAGMSHNEDYVDLMKREEEIRRIYDPAVVRYIDCTRTDSGHVVLVMDYIPGPSLAEEMERRRVAPKELLIIAHRVATGLVAAHSHGIIHRDLSPDNIILQDGDPGEAVIIDFGIAKDTADGARTIVGNDFAGKYEYAAPEQLDGHANEQSDLYALGATLLAAFRGETPFLGTTPGEIVRRKQSPLTTDGVPSPLRELIDELTAKDPADRPANAAAVAEQLGQLLFEKKRAEPAMTKRRGMGRAVVPVLTLLILGAIGTVGYIWRAPLSEALFGPDLPEMSPFVLEASSGAAGFRLRTGHASNPEAARTLADALSNASGQTVAADALTLALGAPNERWESDVAALLGVLGPLESWDVTVSNTSADLSGVAEDGDERNQTIAALDRWQSESQFRLEFDLLTGPVILRHGELTAALSAASTCGPLWTEDRDYELGATVPVVGPVASEADGAALDEVLGAMIGSRTLRSQWDVLNADLCAVRQALPALGPGEVSVWLGNGRDGSTNHTGVYRTEQNPLVQVHLPASISQGYLWVMIVDHTGRVFNVLPHANNNEQRIAQLGQVAGDQRIVPILSSVADYTADRNLLAMRIGADDYGKSEVIAIVSREPLLDLRRPRDESIEASIEAIQAALEGREDALTAIAYRVIDARP
ncbi:MAG: protein kinase [Pseudomonadota bacterium]